MYSWYPSALYILGKLPRFLLFLVMIPVSCKKEKTGSEGLLPSGGSLVFKGIGFENNGYYPKLYTCDSTGISPALTWSGVSSGTKSFVITIHHYPPTGGDKHVYWVVYNIPPTLTDISENANSQFSYGINTVNGKNAYTPPCSQGPGPKVYILTLYALSATPVINLPPSQITMDAVLSSIAKIKLDSAVMNVTYTR